MVRLTSAQAKGTAGLHLRLWKATTSTMCHLFGLHNSSFSENKVLPLCIENDCFLFMTKVMPCAPMGTEEQGPMVLTTMHDIHKMPSHQPSRWVLYSRIKTLLMWEVNLKAIISILAKKASPISAGMQYVSVPHRFLRSGDACLEDVGWCGLEHCRAVRAAEKGCPHGTRAGGTSKVLPLLFLPSWLQVLTLIWPKGRGNQLLVLGKELASKPEESTQ